MSRNANEILRVRHQIPHNSLAFNTRLVVSPEIQSPRHVPEAVLHPVRLTAPENVVPLRAKRASLSGITGTPK